MVTTEASGISKVFGANSGQQSYACHIPRIPPTFSGQSAQDPQKWIKMFERVAKYNKWNETQSLANVVFYLEGTAAQWFDNNEDIINSWTQFKTDLCEVFGQKEELTRRAEMTLKTRAQKPGETTESYIQEILSLCSRVNPEMEEEEKVGHLMEGIAEDFYQALIVKDPTIVDELVKFCRQLENMKQRRIKRTRYERLPNVTPIPSDFEEDLTLKIRRIVQEELQKIMPKMSEITKKDVYPLPRVDDALDNLSGARYYSSMDLRTGYWQIEVDEHDREKTAFITPDGLYEFRVMPFGLCNAPATFERMMDTVLKGLKWNICLCYLDDIVVYGPSFEEHLKRLEVVLECLQQSGLNVNHEKCLFGSRQLKILGHVVNENGIHPDPEKVEAILKFPSPKSFEVMDGVLYKRNYEPYGRQRLLVLPKQMRLEILKNLHDAPTAGHLGFAKTYDRARKRFFWGGMYKTIRQYIAHCRECPRRKSVPQRPPGQLMPIPPANFPFQKIGKDLLGIFPVTNQGNKWIIVRTEYMTRFATTKAIPDAGAMEIAKFIFEEIILRHGAPQQIITDRGTNFMSQIIKEINNLSGISHLKTTAYHPQINGLTERINKTLTDMLSMYVDVEQKNWDEVLPFVTFVYNTAKQETTGFSPFFLAHGREAETTLDSLLPYHDNDNVGDYVEHLITKAEEARHLAQLHLYRGQEKDRVYYDRKHRPVDYNVGDLVLFCHTLRCKQRMVLACDSSSYGLGVILSHRNDRKEECPIAFASRTLTEAEKRFSQLEKKALSITFGVEKFRQYLLGRKFVLVTDNRPLIHIFSPHKPIPICASSRIKRWSLKLAAFNYTVEFRKTSDNSNVDALSRLPLESSVRESLDEDQVLLLRKSNEVPFSFMEVANETPQDKILSIVLRNVREGNCLCVWKFTRVPRENPLGPHYKINEELSLEFGCLQWRERVVIPQKLRYLILNDLHEIHMGIVKMKMIARRYSCQNWIALIFVTDNGRKFVSGEFEQFTKMNGIRHTKTSPYNPSTNGLAERYVREFKNLLRKNNGKDDLETNLQSFLFAHRAFPQTVIKEFPGGTTNEEKFKVKILEYNTKMGNPREVFHEAVRRQEQFTTGCEVYFRNYATGPK
ncbi:hypothetical protein LAZ67_X002854, partial [Cordylochernes scorpioides]